MSREKKADKKSKKYEEESRVEKRGAEQEEEFFDKWYIKMFEPKQKRGYNASIMRMAFLFVALFMILMIYFLHFVIAKGPQVIKSL